MLINNLKYKIDYKEIYKSFLLVFIKSYKGVVSDNELNKIVKSRIINYEDACLFIYIKCLLEGFEYIGLIKEVVINEAHDYSKLQYLIIKNIFRGSDFTILGDINQTVNPYYKYKSLDELCTIFNDSKYLELTKTYRSSQEIIEYTNKIYELLKNEYAKIRVLESNTMEFNKEMVIAPVRV